MSDVDIDFIGIGAPKSGTTWLNNCLDEHPQIVTPSKYFDKEMSFASKEVHFFNDFTEKKNIYSNYQKGLQWYKKRLPKKNNNQVLGEISTSYLADNKAYERIRSHLPNVKIIAQLRNPVDFLYSAFQWNQAFLSNNKSNSFDRLIQANEFSCINLEEAFFYEHLKKFYDNFPSNNIHVILLDDIKENPSKVVREVYHFLDVDFHFVPRSLNIKSNTAITSKSKFVSNSFNTLLSCIKNLGLTKLYFDIKKSSLLHKLYISINTKQYRYPSMQKKTRQILLDYYIDDINKLETLIGRDLSDWKE